MIWLLTVYHQCELFTAVCRHLIVRRTAHPSVNPPHDVRRYVTALEKHASFIRHHIASMGPLEVGPGQGLQIQEVGSPERLMVTSSNCNQSEASGLGYPELNRFHWSLVI